MTEVVAASTVRCVGCRAVVADVDGPTHAYIGASPGCWAIYTDLHAGPFDAAAAAVWPLAVDAYAAQHPGVPGRRSSQSVWVHLVSLCLILEHAWSPADGIAAKQALLAVQRTWTWLEPPAELGPVTVLDAVAAAGSSAFDQTVCRWAASVWGAWEAPAPAVRDRARMLVERR